MKIINNLVMAICATFAIAMQSGAFAAEAMTSFDWNGTYVGINGGYSWNNADVSNIRFEGAPSGIPAFDLNPEGGGVGATLGFNRQTNQLVLGLEGDFFYAWADDSDDTFAPSFTTEGDLEWLSTLRARAGFAADRLLVFATGGLAVGDVEGTIHDNYGGTIVTTHDTNTYWGWTAGGGLEFAVGTNLSLKAEYLYYDLGEEELSVNEGPLGWNPLTADVEVTGSVARIGLNYQF